MEEAVRAENRYLQMQVYQRLPRPGATPVYKDNEPEEEEEPTEAVAQPIPPAEMDQLLRALAEMGRP